MQNSAEYNDAFWADFFKRGQQEQWQAQANCTTKPPLLWTSAVSHDSPPADLMQTHRKTTLSEGKAYPAVDNMCLRGLAETWRAHRNYRRGECNIIKSDPSLNSKVAGIETHKT